MEIVLWLIYVPVKLVYSIMQFFSFMEEVRIYFWRPSSDDIMEEGNIGKEMATAAKSNENGTNGNQHVS